MKCLQWAVQLNRCLFSINTWKTKMLWNFKRGKYMLGSGTAQSVNLSLRGILRRYNANHPEYGTHWLDYFTLTLIYKADWFKSHAAGKATLGRYVGQRFKWLSFP